MTIFNHGVTGAAIALTAKQPWLAVPLAFLSHFAQDMIPHSDYFAGRRDEKLFSRQFNTMFIIDMVLSLGLLLILGLVIFPSHKWLIWSCMAAAACPDVMQSYYFLYLRRIKNIQPRIDPISKFHYSLQNESAAGGLVEIVWAVAGLIIIWTIK